MFRDRATVAAADGELLRVGFFVGSRGAANTSNGSPGCEKLAASARIPPVAPASREYLVYADGSCLGNPGPGGWGVVVRDPNGVVTELNGHDDYDHQQPHGIDGRDRGPARDRTRRGGDSSQRQQVRREFDDAALQAQQESRFMGTARRRSGDAARTIRMGARTRHRCDQQSRRRTRTDAARIGKLVADGASPEKRKPRASKHRRLSHRARADRAAKARANRFANARDAARSLSAAATATTSARSSSASSRRAADATR